MMRKDSIRQFKIHESVLFKRTFIHDVNIKGNLITIIKGHVIYISLVSTEIPVEYPTLYCWWMIRQINQLCSRAIVKTHALK